MQNRCTLLQTHSIPFVGESRGDTCLGVPFDGAAIGFPPPFCLKIGRGVATDEISGPAKNIFAIRFTCTSGFREDLDYIHL